MADTIQSVLIGGVAGLVSAIVTYFSTLWKTRLELTVEYDKDLQKSRLAAYALLWGILDKIAKYGREGPVTYDVLREVSNATRDWYFHNGGIYLTRASRKPYFQMKKLMQPILDDPHRFTNANGNIRKEFLEPIIDAGSALRTSLSDDIGTKRVSWLGGGILEELSQKMNAPE
jgi:hypothetical protein